VSEHYTAPVGQAASAETGINGVKKRRGLNRLREDVRRDADPSVPPPMRIERATGARISSRSAANPQL